MASVEVRTVGAGVNFIRGEQGGNGGVYEVFYDRNRERLELAWSRPQGQGQEITRLFWVGGRLRELDYSGKKTIPEGIGSMSAYTGERAVNCARVRLDDGVGQMFANELIGEVLPGRDASMADIDMEKTWGSIESMCRDSNFDPGLSLVFVK